ncbi:MAG TPA: FAD-dependent oxidoreductase, partial [Nitrospirota bacterium]|nr:FAD-dependent oxidoreductase [Nitrospirota bacterium]
SHEALGSTRVMGACMALGEQAGRAAAYRVKHGIWPVV